MKYFKETKSRMQLSKYLETADTDKRQVEYLITVLGDIDMDSSIIKTFTTQFRTFGGRYDVRVEKDTLKEMYKLTLKYPFLSEQTIEMFFSSYIKDLYDEYDLIDVFDKYLEMFGKTSDAIEGYFDYVERKAEIKQKEYEDEAKKLDEIKDIYGEKFISHLKSRIMREHIPYEKLEKFLPSPELLKKDEEHILEISRKSRIFFGCCEPVSYTLFDILVDKGSIEEREEPGYYISYYPDKIPATFTKQEFIESIKQQKIKQKRK